MQRGRTDYNQSDLDPHFIFGMLPQDFAEGGVEYLHHCSIKERSEHYVKILQVDVSCNIPFQM
ncbi:hypothetical protein DPMN_007350 [Dreissena polymorpha]|uniref:Uncharacterized protein n=1 Tax=Dreissena polymorpha TaxID=45954 RepID=A0A9D4RY74_DREPO|nr:hypothetical protein DPMN_007350 [Dreissena polymorpha]